MTNVEFISGTEVNPTAISDLEEALNVVFPKTYKQIILKHNGSYVMPDVFFVGDSIESINNFHDVTEQYHFVDERLPERVIPFARDAGDNQICFDYRVEGKVEILFWDHAMEVYEKGALKFIADSYDEFLAGLFEFNE